MSIKFALLSLLAEQPASVGQLKSTFEQRTHDTWPVNVGQVYQTVQRLLRDGLVEITTDSSGTAPGSGPSGRQPGRHTEVFVPTADGLAELNHWWREPILPPPNYRDDLVIKTAMAAATTPGSLPAGLSFTDVLHEQRLAVLGELRELTIRKAQIPPSTAADRLQLERRIFDLESQIRWLDQIEQFPAAPPTAPSPSTTDSPVTSNPTDPTQEPS